MTPAELRALFPITATRACLYSGALSPAAAPVRAAHDRWTERWALDPAEPYAHYRDEWELARQRFAALIGADPAEVAVVDNTSRASNLAVQMIAAPPGSNVVVDEYTYPSSLYPWLLPARSHVELRYVPAREHRVLLDDLARAVDDRTVALSVSHVSPKTGFRHDLRALADLAHAHGAYLVVDAAQSAGALDLDVRRDGVDLLSTCAMKWLLGAPGVGFLYVRGELIERCPPPQVGYPGLVRPPVFDPNDPNPVVYRPGALRYEVGMPDLPGLAATRAGLDLLLAVGIAAVERQVRALTDALVEGLLRRDLRLLTRPEPELRAGVIALQVPDAAALEAFLRARGVDAWGDRQQLQRADPHCFNNQEDIDRFLEGLDEFARTQGRGALVG